VHDHPLIPFAAELRKRGVGNLIGFFLHIPFPPWQTFMAVPEHKELGRALAAYDLVGLQTKADVANLINYMTNALYGRIVPDGRIRLFDRLVSVASFPIGIDRLDYTKGLPHKFKAFGQLLDKYPQYQGEVVLTQIAPPTRESVEAYSDVRHELESLVKSSKSA
jgi:trehalose 6-phosphate synthase